MTVTFHRSKKTTKQRASKSEARQPYSVSEESMSTAPFYEMLENLQRGILPHNDELTSWFQSIRSSGVLMSGDLSETGKKLTADIEELIGLMEKVILTKNQDEIIQQFLYHARLAARIAAEDISRTGKYKVVDNMGKKVYLGGTKEMKLKREAKVARKKAQRNVCSLVQMLKMMFTSTKFRDVVSDSQRLMRKALSPSQHPPQQQPTVVMSVLTEPHYEKTTLYHEQASKSSIDELKWKVSKASEDLSRLKERIPVERYDVPIAQNDGPTKTAREPTMESISQDIPQSEFQRAERLPIVSEAYPDVSYEPAGRPIFSEPSRTEPQTQAPSTQQPQQPPTLPQEKDSIEELIDELRRILKILVANPEVQAIGKELYRFLAGTFQVTLADETLVPRELKYEANFQQAQRDLLRILERFANNNSLEPTVQTIQSIRKEAARDYRLKDFIGDWTAYLIRSIQDPEYIDHEAFRNRGRFLFERTRELHNQKYRPMFDTAFDSFKAFTEGWSKDQLSVQVAQCLNKIFSQDLFGQPDVSDKAPGLMVLNLLKPDLFNDLRNVLLPNILRQLHQVPLPRIEALYGPNRLVLENLVLPADAFLPMDFEMEAKSSLKLHPKSRIFGRSGKVEPDRGWKNGMVIRLGDIKTSVRDVKFIMDHSSAFPRFKDIGLADLEIGGRKGMSIVINILADMREATMKEEGTGRILPHYVRVSIDRLKIKFHHSQHDSTYALLGPLITYVAKKAIETTVRDRIVQSVEFLDDVMYRFGNPAKRSS